MNNIFKLTDAIKTELENTISKIQTTLLRFFKRKQSPILQLFTPFPVTKKSQLCTGRRNEIESETGARNMGKTLKREKKHHES